MAINMEIGTKGNERKKSEEVQWNEGSHFQKNTRSYVGKF